MREFMDYIQSAFYGATGWDRDNSYSSLNATAASLLKFPTPRGVRVTLASLASPQFATAYQLSTIGLVDGSVSYLYSTVALRKAIAQSDRIPLPDLLRSYRTLNELPAWTPNLLPGWDTTRKETLAYGRLYLPRSMLEALVVKRLTSTLQMQVSAVSDQTLRNGGIVLGMLQYDRGRYGVEGLASTEGGLLGVRGLFNFGGDATNSDVPAWMSKSETECGGNAERDRVYGRFSVGAELYYGALDKSGGMSVGARFATLPSHQGTPLTATMTINPLMGNVSWTYAVMAGKYCSLATTLDFNIHSYESEWAIGTELWRKKGAWEVPAEEDAIPPARLPYQRSFEAKMQWRLDDPPPDPQAPVPISGAPETKLPPLPNKVTEPRPRERSFQAKMEWRLDKAELDLVGPGDEHVEEYAGVLKARVDQHLKIGLLWEGRAKSLIFSLGSAIDLRRLDSPFRGVGLDVQFSS